MNTGRTYSLDCGLGLELLQVFESHDFAADELLLKIGAGPSLVNTRKNKVEFNDSLDDAGRLRCLGPLTDCPRSDLIGSTGKVPDQLLGLPLSAARPLLPVMN
jgi:hypothetical protein